MTRLVLAGGGHVQLAVLKALAAKRIDGLDAVLVTPASVQYYSGMLPGWMAGHYRLEQCAIDLQALAHAAGVRMLPGHVVGMDAMRQNVTLADGQVLDYDLLSLDIGREARLTGLEAAGPILLPVRPLDNFVAAWPALLESVVAHGQEGRRFRLLVAGGGAGGVEIACAARHAFTRRKLAAQVALATTERGLLAGHAPRVVERVRTILQTRGIELLTGRVASPHGKLMLERGENSAENAAVPVAADAIIAATGGQAPGWLTASHLALDQDGYVAVDASHRSRSHPNVLAAGDICARSDVTMQRSGVHAVRAGQVVAANLRAMLTQGPLQDYMPRRQSLYLITTGPRHAIASWGNISLQGGWVWHWKDTIDRRFMARHR